MFSSLLGDIRQNWAENSNKSNQARPDATTRPRVIAPYLYQLSIWIWWNTSGPGPQCPLFCMYFPSNQTFSYSSETQDLGKVSMILLRPVWASVYATQHKKYMEWGQNSDWSLSGNPSLHLLNTSQENVLNVRSTDGCWTHWTHSRCFKYCSMKQLSIQCIYIGVLWRRFKNFCHAHSFISAFEPFLSRAIQPDDVLFADWSYHPW